MQCAGDVLLFVAWGLHVKQWGGTTIKNYVTGVSAFHNCLIAANVIGPGDNPCSSTPVKHCVRAAAKHFRKQSKASEPIALRLLSDMLAACPDTRAGWHLRINLWLRFLGCIRTTACANIKVRYTVKRGVLHFQRASHIAIKRDPDSKKDYVHITIKADKNRNPTMAFREVVLPESITSLGVHPVAELRHYLVTYRPHNSNKFLLAAPLGNTGAYRDYKADKWGTVHGYNPNAALKKLALRVDPKLSKSDLATLSTTSLRKGLADTVHADGWPPSVMADLGAWKIPRTAMDSYFKTSRATLLIALATLTLRHGPKHFAAKA